MVGQGCKPLIYGNSSRHATSNAAVDALTSDLRYAWRAMVKNPGVAALSIVCLALGIGVNSTIFSVVDTVAVRPLPFRAPEELVALHTTLQANGIDRGNVSWLDVRDWREQTQAFAEIASVTGRSLTLSDGDEPERFNGATVSANLFPMLGVDPVLGRPFRADEDRPGAPPVVLLSHGVWQRRYGGDIAIVGRVLTINGVRHTVVGVMPPKFQFPVSAQLWIPQAPIESASPRSQRNLGVYARLKPGRGLEDGRRDIERAAASLGAGHREDQGWSATAIPLRTELIPSDIRLVVFSMMGAVTLVLLIACANVANMLLARATVRQREIAVRSALGAGRGRIVRQLLIESLLLGAVSAPFGVAVAAFGLRWLTASIPPGNQAPYYIDWSMNPRVVVYTSIVALATGIVFGLAPALQAGRARLQEALKEGGRGSSSGRHRLRGAVVDAEIALSLVLLVGASLFIRSFLNLQDARAGIDTSPLLTMRFYMPGEQYDAPDAMVRRVADVVRRIEALPGVTAAFASNMVPLAGGGSDGGVVAEGASYEPGKEPQTSYFGVTPHVLTALNVPVVSGRAFTDAEGQTRSPVAIVNGVFARRMWPNDANVVGKRFRLAAAVSDDKNHEWLTVVGVVGDFRLFSVRDGKPSPYAFLPYPYDPTRNTGVTVRVAGGAPAALAGRVRAELRGSDPTLPVFAV